MVTPQRSAEKAQINRIRLLARAFALCSFLQVTTQRAENTSPRLNSGAASSGSIRHQQHTHCPGSSKNHVHPAPYRSRKAKPPQKAVSSFDGCIKSCLIGATSFVLESFSACLIHRTNQAFGRASCSMIAPSLIGRPDDHMHTGGSN